MKKSYLISVKETGQLFWFMLLVLCDRYVLSRKKQELLALFCDLELLDLIRRIVKPLGREAAQLLAKGEDANHVDHEDNTVRKVDEHERIGDINKCADNDHHDDQNLEAVANDAVLEHIVRVQLDTFEIGNQRAQAEEEQTDDAQVAAEGPKDGAAIRTCSGETPSSSLRAFPSFLKIVPTVLRQMKPNFLN